MHVKFDLIMHVRFHFVDVELAGSPAASRGMTGTLQSQHGAGIALQAFHAEHPRLENFFDATDDVAKIAAGLHGRWLANVFVAHDRMQSPHETDMGLQAPYVITEMAAALPVLLVDHKKICGNCRQCCMHGHMLQDCDDLQSVEEFLGWNVSTVTLPNVAVIPRPDVVGDSYWPAD